MSDLIVMRRNRKKGGGNSCLKITMIGNAVNLFHALLKEIHLRQPLVE